MGSNRNVKMQLRTQRVENCRLGVEPGRRHSHIGFGQGPRQRDDLLFVSSIWDGDEAAGELDAATKLSEVKAIADELHRTRAALREAKATAGRVVPRPKRGTSVRSRSMPC